MATAGVLLAAVALLATACGGNHEAAPATTVAPTTVASTTTTSTTTIPPTTTTTVKPAVPVAPLTGLPEPSAAVRNRAAVVVKIDNVDAARPQSGINQADVVYEEMVEGGLTRLAAVFQSQLPDPVGPVRSGRTTDEGIIDDLNYPVFAYSGANADFQAELLQQPVVNANDDNQPGLFTRMGPNPAPHNLYVNTTDLIKLADSSKGPPPPLFAYKTKPGESPGAGATKVASATVAFPSAVAVWSWNPKTRTWTRAQNSIGPGAPATPSVDKTGEQVSVPNVVIQAIPYSTALTETNGTPIPFGDMVGTGQAWILNDGEMVAANWSRPALTSVTTFTAADGKPVLLTPGRTWVELVPAGSTPSFSDTTTSTSSTSTSSTPPAGG